MERAAYFIYLVVLVISPVLFGAVHTWVYTLVFLLILAATLLLLPQNIVKTERGTYAFRFPKTGMLPLYIGFIVLLIVQMIPLPPDLLFWLSPEARVVGGYGVPAANMVGGAAPKDQWLPLASYVFPVRMSLIRWVVYGLFFFGLLQTLNSRKRIETVILLVLCLGALEALYGIIDTYSGNNRMLWAKRSKEMAGVAGTYESTNHFAGLMEMGIVLAVAYAGAFAVHRRRTIPGAAGLREKILALFSTEGFFTRRFLIVFTGAVMGVGLLLSKSRGGIVAAAGTLLFLGLFFVFREAQRKKGIIVLILFLITSGFALFIGIDRTFDRFQNMPGDYHARSLIAQNAVQIFKDYPVMGVGIGDFRHAYPKYQDPRFKRSSMIYAHNDWVQLLSESGIVGMVLFVAGMGFYLVFVVRRLLARHDAFAICLGGAALAALVSIGIHSWTDFNLRIPANFMILTAVLAIGFCALHLKEERRHDVMTYALHKSPLRRGGTVILVLLIALILWTGWGLFRHFVAEAYCTTEANPSLNLNPLPPIGRIERAIVWDGANAAYHYKMATLLTKEEDREAQRQAQIPGDEREKAVSRDDLQRRTIDALEEAIRLNPLNAEYHTRLAWEYTHLWYRADYVKKWLPAADISMERASHVAGDWAENPHLHLDMGNYWTMRSRSLPPEDPQVDIAWTKALWHYHKGLAMNGDKKAKEEITQFVKNFYPDETKIKEALNEVKNE